MNRLVWGFVWALATGHWALTRSLLIVNLVLLRPWTAGQLGRREPSEGFLRCVSVGWVVVCPRMRKCVCV